MTYARLIRRVMKRETTLQKFNVPKGSKPVAFLNRSGEPTIYFEAYGGDDAVQETMQFVLTPTGNECPPGGSVDFIGVQEFAGGQYVWACWRYRSAKE